MEEKLYIRKKQRYLLISRIVASCAMFFLSLPPCFSQITNGGVRGQGGEFLIGASVVAKDKGGKIVAYAITDGNGRYKLTLPSNSEVAFVSASYIGYQTKTLPANEFKDGMTIVLSSGKIKLREVTIKSDRLRRTGDTLTYSVSGFRQRQDRSIADVIAKMPGIEVKADGKVEYQGKAISNYYIEGLDLMGSQYGIANNNISADKVISVQVLQNHQPVESLRGVAFSDQAALNIVLKEDAKAAWNGTVDVGIGGSEDGVLYDCRLMEMRFGKKFQALMMYKNNNVGQDISIELLDLTKRQDENMEIDHSFISMPTISAPNLESERHTFNRSHLIAGNYLWRIDNRSNLRLKVNALLDKEKMNDYNQITYLTVDGQPVITEERTLFNTRNEWKGGVQYQHNGKNTYVINDFNVNLNFNKSLGQAGVSKYYTDMMARPEDICLTNNFRYSHTTHNKNVYEIRNFSHYSYSPQKLQTLNGIVENLNLRTLFTHNSVHQKIRLGHHYLNQEVGLEYEKQQIASSFSPESYQYYTYQIIQTYWQPSLSLQSHNHKFTAILKQSLAHQEYANSSSNQVWVEPALQYHWQLSSVSEFSLSLKDQFRPMKVKDIVDTPIFYTYQSQRINRGKVDTQNIWTFNLSYQYSNPIKGLFFNIRPILSFIKGNVLYESRLENGVFTLAATDRDGTMQTNGAACRLSKSFRWAKTVMALGTSFMRSEYDLLVNDAINDVQMRTLNASFEYSLHPVGVLSIEGKSKIQRNSQRNLSHPELAFGNDTHWQHHLSLFLLLSQTWNVGIHNDFSHHVDRSLGNNYFCDCSICYRASRWELTIVAHNLFNSSHYETVLVNNMMDSRYGFRLRPRECILKYSFDL